MVVILQRRGLGNFPGFALDGYPFPLATALTPSEPVVSGVRIAIYYIILRAVGGTALSGSYQLEPLSDTQTTAVASKLVWPRFDSFRSGGLHFLTPSIWPS